MSAIRPDMPSMPPVQLAGPSAAARAAQAAFFRAALTGAEAARPAQAQPQASTPVDAERATRPGSLLDIRV